MSTLSKEEILDKCSPDLIEYPHYYLDNFQTSVALEAMNEYAEQEAILFFAWVIKSAQKLDKTPYDIYQLYLKSKEK